MILVVFDSRSKQQDLLGLPNGLRKGLLSIAVNP